MYDPYADFTKHVLSNGLEVHTQYMDRPWIRMEVVVFAGGREDPVDMPGLGHFVEHILGKNIPDWERNHADEFFESLGGSVDFGNTSYFSTEFNFKVPAEIKMFRKALKIFGSMLFEARIKKDVEKERKIILQEYIEHYFSPEILEWSMSSRRSLFKNHRLETWNIPLGLPHGFLHVTSVDLQRYYDMYYTPANMSVVFIGGLQTEVILEELEKSSFGIKKKGVRNAIPLPYTQLHNPTDSFRKVRYSDFSSFVTDQTQYTATWALSASISPYTLKVFDEVLGKILFEEIRERRELSYALGTNYTYFQDVYEYTLGTRINSDATGYIDELVKKCISLVARNESLFESIKRASMQECLMIDLSGEELAKEVASHLAQYHRIIPMFETWEELHQVTFEQIGEMTELLSPERQHTFITVP